MSVIRACLPVAVLLLTASAARAAAQTVPGEIDHIVIHGDGTGLLDGVLQDGDDFGCDIEALGDLDGDGVVDLIVGADSDDFFGAFSGAVHVLFLQSDGSLKAHVEIDDFDLAEDLALGDFFGSSVATLGDLDGDGSTEVAVGMRGDDDLRSDSGAVLILSLDASGQVVGVQKISNLAGGLGPVLRDGDFFGAAVEALGDLDGDGVGDLAVGSYRWMSNADDIGNVRILFLNADGTVKAQQLISPNVGGFTGSATDDDVFGNALARLGDLDGDGITELAVGAGRHGGAGLYAGSVWIFFLDTDGTLKGNQLVGGTAGGLQGQTRPGDRFGTDLAPLGDLDGDGVPDLAVQAPLDGLPSGPGDDGTAWLLFLHSDGTVKNHRTLGRGLSGHAPPLTPRGLNGGLALLGDLDGDGHDDLVTALQFFLDPLPVAFGGRIHINFLRPGHWRDLGLGLAGGEGIPSLDGAGLPLDGENVILALHDAPADALALLAVGASRVDLGLHGGTLVPSPDLVLGIPLDDEGLSILNAGWPTGVPAGFQVWLQAWYVDAGGPFGYAASNGVVVTTP